MRSEHSLILLAHPHFEVYLIQFYYVQAENSPSADPLILAKIVQLVYTFAQHSVIVISALKLTCFPVIHISTSLIGKDNWLLK